MLQFRDRGIGQLLLMNRSLERAEKLATEFRGTVVPWGVWDAALLTPDVIVSSVASEEPILQRAILERAMSARANRALFIMDLGLPRNIEPAAAEIYNVYLYNLDDLGGIVQQSKAMRENEIPRAETIVDEHVGKFLSWQAEVGVVGLVDELRTRLQHERDRKSTRL